MRHSSLRVVWHTLRACLRHKALCVLTGVLATVVIVMWHRSVSAFSEETAAGVAGKLGDQYDPR